MNYAYFAGLLDGEGYISLIPSGYVSTYSGKKPLCPVIKVSMTSEAMIDMLHKELGGYKESRVFTSGNNSKPAYTWVAKGIKQVEPVLRKVHRYLVLKKPQSQLVQEFIELSKATMYDRTTWQVKYKYYEKLKELNRRGRAVAETK